MCILLINTSMILQLLSIFQYCLLFIKLCFGVGFKIVVKQNVIEGTAAILTEGASIPYSIKIRVVSYAIEGALASLNRYNKIMKNHWYGN